MKCVNCEKAEAAAGWDSLAFERRKEWQSVYEWATGYEKAGLCPACRADLARENAAITLAMPAAEHERPKWDMEIAKRCGFSSWGADPGAGKRILQERDLADAPLFLLWARK